MEENKEKGRSLRIGVPVIRKYEKIDDFRSYYVTGAIGGFKTKYDFRLSFYNIDTNDFIMKAEEKKSRKNVRDEELEELVTDLELKHDVMCEVIMSETAARELHQFIGRQLKAREEAIKMSQKGTKD
ncbi:MAG: hypothetical protein GF311_10095 [Candidatus Lokiarchaeota archaeon]|nr:hypothetical protein [Candidatus Lokiarchaeota archaeon]